MEKQITISLNSYDIEAWKHEILWHCLHDNPTLTKQEICILLGIGRTAFHDLCVKNQIYHTGKQSKILPNDLEEIPKFKPK